MGPVPHDAFDETVGTIPQANMGRVVKPFRVIFEGQNPRGGEVFRQKVFQPHDARSILELLCPGAFIGRG